MIVRVEVVKNKEESPANLVRRFTKRLRGSGILKDARAGRYWKRRPSEQTKKARALKRIEKEKRIAQLRKLGKIKDAFHSK